MSVVRFQKGQTFVGKKNPEYFKRIRLNDSRYSLAVFEYKQQYPHVSKETETAAIAFKCEMDKDLKVFVKHAEFDELLEYLESLGKDEDEIMIFGEYNITLYHIVDEIEGLEVPLLKVAGLYQGRDGKEIFIGLASKSWKNMIETSLEPNYGIYIPISLYGNLVNALKEAIVLGKDLEKTIKTQNK